MKNIFKKAVIGILSLFAHLFSKKYLLKFGLYGFNELSDSNKLSLIDIVVDNSEFFDEIDIEKMLNMGMSDPDLEVRMLAFELNERRKND